MWKEILHGLCHDTEFKWLLIIILMGILAFGGLAYYSFTYYSLPESISKSTSQSTALTLR